MKRLAQSCGPEAVKVERVYFSILCAASSSKMVRYGDRRWMELGLVNFVRDKDELGTRLERLTFELKGFPTETIGPFKRLTNDTVFADLEVHLDMERSSLSELWRSPGFRQRVEGFFTKKSGGSQ